MKTEWVLVMVLVLVSLFHAIKAVQSSVITGRIVPHDAADQVFAVQGQDSLKTVPDNGKFTLQAKPGTYTVIIHSSKSYKDVLLELVKVNERKITDLGEIKIIQ
ncbi:MAG: carboxypeptidase regulatory-like domain-containing protein [Chitinophagaceae bacterium]